MKRLPKILALQRPCPICDCKEGGPLFHQQFSMMSNGSLLGGYDVVVCLNCGFGFADNIPEQAVIDSYYRDMSKYECPTESRRENEYELTRLGQSASIIEQFLPDTNARIMDVGCATGRLPHILKQAGYHNVWGLDPSPGCAEDAQRLYGVNVLTGTLFTLPEPNEPYDFMVLSGVIEHIRDLHFALARCSSLLGRNGRMYVCVPDASRFAEGENAPFQEFSVEHINFFGPISLGNLMRTNGFVETHCGQELIEVGFRTSSPIIHAVFEKDETNPGPTPLVRDNQTEPALRQYISQCDQADQQIHQVIDRLASRGEPVIVWGAGAHTLRLLATSRLSEANISAFVDSNPRYQGKRLHGVPIIAPIDLKGRPEAILLSSRVFQEEIEQQIRQNLNLKNELILLYQF
jgi:SAM-dependent methyltransferase